LIVLVIAAHSSLRKLILELQIIGNLLIAFFLQQSNYFVVQMQELVSFNYQ